MKKPQLLVTGVLGGGGPSDTTRPTVAITSSETSPTSAATVPLTITFSEAVTGFVVGDITVVGCTLSSFAGSGTTYTVTATPTARSMTIDIAEGVAADAAGNTNTAATQFPMIWEYAEKVADTFTTAIVSELPLYESAGPTADDYYSTNRDGAYSAANITYAEAGIGDGRTSVKFTGAAYVNWYSAGLASAFSDAEGSLMGWIKVSAAGVWTDGLIHVAAMIKVNSNNFVSITKTATDGRLEFVYMAGGTQEQYRNESNSGTGWMHVAITWSKSNDRTAMYVNGTAVGGTGTLGTWTGSLNTSACCIGAAVNDGTQPWSGWLAHWTLLNREATPTEVSSIASLPF